MIYEYRCEDCSKLFEVWAKMSDPPPAVCPTCGASKIERVISATAFALKGSGWYTSDYKRKEAAPAAPKSAGAEPTAGSTPVAAETKAATTSDTTSKASSE